MKNKSLWTTAWITLQVTTKPWHYTTEIIVINKMSTSKQLLVIIWDFFPRSQKLSLILPNDLNKVISVGFFLPLFFPKTTSPTSASTTAYNIQKNKTITKLEALLAI